eukprot:TRINITY_DN4669_c0_g1_i1.p1 TRINITY_DN4669_c0_g1~~TRINITY_DN4669_c0_g1_i1.p1  ORF type:complete len:646 (+),score=181.01 TRINITY_DN4669_c0_g1_i1:128-1939(+)
MCIRDRRRVHGYIDKNMLRKEYLMNLWTAILRFVKIFSLSKNPNSVLWMLEVLFLASIRYNPKEIISDNKMKKEMHDLENALLINAASLAAKQQQIFFNDPGLGSSSPGSAHAKYKTVLPYSPTVYALYLQHKGKNAPTSAGGSSPGKRPGGMDEYDIEDIMFDNETITETFLYDKYRFYTFKTLRRLGLTLLQNTYSPERTDRVVVRTKDFMEIIFPVLENKERNNQLFLECASELLYSQLDTARAHLMKEFKKNILDIFLGQDFFKCNKRTLKLWSKIIDWVVSQDKSDLFSEMLNKVSSFSFIFGKDSETKQKIKNFERVCFMIYSGDRDKYQSKLRFLLEKMSEVIKNAESAPPALLILILFCIRILILRLSSITLAELFRSIWPMLLTLLIQIFNRKNTNKNPNLILAGLKLIELISVIGLEEFYIHQWIFVFDYFGLKMESIVPTNSANNFNYYDANSKPGDKTNYSPFEFQPYISNTIPEDFKINYKNTQNEVQKEYAKRKRGIIMTQTSVEDEIEIKNKALALCQYMMSNNEFRSVVDSSEVENLIEGDFISLDDYIFNLQSYLYIHCYISKYRFIVFLAYLRMAAALQCFLFKK